MTSPFSSIPTSFVAATGDYRIDALRQGVKWGDSTGSGANLSFSFAGPGSTWRSGYGSSELSGAVTSLNALEQAEARRALAAWSDVANLHFNEVSESSTNVGDIRLAFSTGLSSNAYAWAYYPDSYFPEGGDIWLNSNYAWSFGDGSSSFKTLIHEIGHALGLKHPFEGTDILVGAEDTRQYSVMSYTGYYAGTGAEPITPMLYDVLAIQHIYGANMTTRAGDTVYQFTSKTDLQTIWDAGGNDTFDCSQLTSSVAIDLRAGHFSSIGVHYGSVLNLENVAIAFGATIENATGGSASDTLIGNEVNNILIGNAGNDTLDGVTGIDTLIGGIGNDTYRVDGQFDVIIETADGGIDTVEASASRTLPDNVENLVLTGTAAINGTGNALNNQITGNSAANILDGVTGIDTLIGGDGNDIYRVDGQRDVIIETATGGIDTVEASASRILPDNVENLVLTGTASISGTGNALDNYIIGNSGANRLSGSNGNDTIEGGDGADTIGGNAGADRLIGGAGADVFDFNVLTHSTPAAFDRIIGFDAPGDASGDRIDLSDIDADTTLAGNNAFIFGGDFTAGHLRLFTSGSGSTRVEGNVDNDSDVELMIVIEDGAISHTAYSAADFIL